MTADMVKVSQAIKLYLLKNAQGESFTVKDLTHMVFIAYYDKKGDKKNVDQLAYHRDQRYTRKGNFMHTMNSQEKDTATCILTLGDPRTLHLQCFRDNDKRDGKGSIKIHKQYASEEVVLNHGSLFVLHPKDEETVLRQYFHDTKSTFFKHGKIMFGRKGLSIGLAFRTTVHYKEVEAETGKLVLRDEIEAIDKYQANVRVLDEYLADESRKCTNDNKLTSLYLDIKKKYFGEPPD